MTRRFLPGLFIALGVLALGLIVAFTVGRYPVTLAELADVLLSRITGRPSTAPAAVENVVLLVRGPRVLAAVMVGAALAVAGTAFQGLFRNPLVSPDILGASSGAALGAVLGIYFSLGVIGIEILAFVGGLVAVAAVYVIGSLLQARDPILVLVLTGVVVGALLGAGIGLVKYLADPYNQLPAMTFWLLGSLAATTASDLVPLAGPVALGTAVLVALRWRLNVMSLPEDEARTLGVATGPLRITIVVAATLVTSASVATSGIIGWVGLVVPHLARALVGPDFPRLVPTAGQRGRPARSGDAARSPASRDHDRDAKRTGGDAERRASSSGSDITFNRHRNATSTAVPSATGPASGTRSEAVVAARLRAARRSWQEAGCRDRRDTSPARCRRRAGRRPRRR